MYVKPFHFYPVDDLYDGEICLRILETAEAQPEKGWVPHYILSICQIATLCPVGKITLRLGETEALRYGGQVGYEVAEECRGNHYASKACKLVQKLAAKHGMKRLFITCSPENLASRRSCVLAGARYIETLKVPVNHDLYQHGEREVMVFMLPVT